MVCMVVVHMTQVFPHAAYKYPRELNWLTGVLLLFFTLGMAFTGQVLCWDADVDWGVGVGASMAGRVPGLGPYLVDLLLGGPLIGSDTLSRFFALHVFIIPGLLLTFLAVHLWLVLKRGISEPPVPGKTVDPRTYQEEYEKELKKDGVPFFGGVLFYHALFSSLTVVVIVVLAAIAGPKGPGALPEPALLGANPKPDWPFWWLFAPLFIEPARSGNVHHPGFARGADLRFAAGAVCVQSRRAGAEPPASGGVVRHRDRHGDCRVDVPGRDLAVVAGHGRLERQRRAGKPGPGEHAAATSGSSRFSEQAMPKLPRLAGHRGPSRTGPDQGRQPPDTRPAHRSGQ